MLFFIQDYLLLFVIYAGYLTLSFMEVMVPERMGAVPGHTISSLLVVKLIATFLDLAKFRRAAVHRIFNMVTGKWEHGTMLFLVPGMNDTTFLVPGMLLLF